MLIFADVASDWSANMGGNITLHSRMELLIHYDAKRWGE